MNGNYPYPSYSTSERPHGPAYQYHGPYYNEYAYHSVGYQYQTAGYSYQSYSNFCCIPPSNYYPYVGRQNDTGAPNYNFGFVYGNNNGPAYTKKKIVDGPIYTPPTKRFKPNSRINGPSANLKTLKDCLPAITPDCMSPTNKVKPNSKVADADTSANVKTIKDCITATAITPDCISPTKTIKPKSKARDADTNANVKTLKDCVTATSIISDYISPTKTVKPNSKARDADTSANVKTTAVISEFTDSGDAALSDAETVNLIDEDLEGPIEANPKDISKRNKVKPYRDKYNSHRHSETMSTKTHALTSLESEKIFIPRSKTNISLNTQKRSQSKERRKTFKINKYRKNSKEIAIKSKLSSSKENTATKSVLDRTKRKVMKKYEHLHHRSDAVSADSKKHSSKSVLSTRDSSNTFLKKDGFSKQPEHVSRLVSRDMPVLDIDVRVVSVKRHDKPVQEKETEKRHVEQKTSGTVKHQISTNEISSSKAPEKHSDAKKYKEPCKKSEKDRKVISDDQNKKIKRHKSERNEKNGSSSDKSKTRFEISNQRAPIVAGKKSAYTEAESSQVCYLDETKQVSITKQNTESNSLLFSNEDIKKLDKTLGCLKSNTDDNMSNNVIDLEVEEIMSKVSPKPTQLRARGKSCLPFDREQPESPSNLVRSKSLQGRDFLCYTPFRITRSISRNWLLSSGIPDGGVRKTLMCMDESEPNKAASIKRRRKTIADCESGECESSSKRRPSLFSEQTEYTKPPEIEFSFTPRYNEDDIERVVNTSDVTVIYRDDSPDPRKTSAATKIKYNGRELIRYEDYVKENVSQPTVTPTKAVPQKVTARRKSVAKDDDPDYVPYCKIICVPQRNVEPVLGNNSEAEVVRKKAYDTRRTSLHKSNNVDTDDTKIAKAREHSSKTSTTHQPKSNCTINLEGRLKHYDLFVSYLPCFKNSCGDLDTTPPETCKATPVIVKGLRLLGAKVNVTTSSVSEQYTNVSILNAKSRSGSSNFNTDVTEIFDKLTNYVFIIQVLRVSKYRQNATFNVVSLPQELRAEELGNGNAYFDQRMRYWIEHFHKTCETLNWAVCSPSLFVTFLKRAVEQRQPPMHYNIMLAILNYILNECLSSGMRRNYAVELNKYITYKLQKQSESTSTANTTTIISNEDVPSKSTTTVSSGQNQGTNSIQPQAVVPPRIGQISIQPLPTAASSVASPAKHSNLPQQARVEPTFIQKPPSASSSLEALLRRSGPQQQPRAGDVSAATTSTPVIQVITTAQRARLQHQIAKYNDLMKSYRSIVPRLPQQNASPIDARMKNIPAQRPSSSDLPLELAVPGAKKCIPPNVTVVNGKVLIDSPKRVRRNNRSGAVTVPSDSANLTCPVTIPLQKVSVSAPLQSSLPTPPMQKESMQDARVTAKVTGDKDDTGSIQMEEVNSSEPDSVSREVVANVHEEFVDFERYFSNNDSEAMSLELSDDKQEASVFIEVPAKRQKLTDASISEEPPPRNASHDSGLDSPTQVEASFLDLEKRTCLCGQPAIYLCPCKLVMYCSSVCQLDDWPSHKTSCEHKKEL